MARKKGRPPKTPSSSSKKTPSAEKRPEASSSSLEFSLSDEEELEDIESLTPKKAAELLQSIYLLRQRVQSKIPVVQKDKQNEMNINQQKVIETETVQKQNIQENRPIHSVW
ncbi:hypothetical protein RIF29_10237 [Crotalaria pallida]|uniref:Uncharacterized protein n=1 Tax=Crotalaria pallida TaxID=3830 RepID=A0AAN9FVJ5_CROPI